MKINSIEWHKENMKNSKIFENKLAKELSDLHIRLSKLRMSNSFYNFQIKEAESINKKLFDRDKFRIKSRTYFD